MSAVRPFSLSSPPADAWWHVRPFSLFLASALLAAPALALAQAPACPQLFAGGQPPALPSPKLGQRTTLLCNNAYAVLASGAMRGALWSAHWQHPCENLR